MPNRAALAFLGFGLVALLAGVGLHAYASFGEADTTVAELRTYSDAAAVRAARGDTLHVHGVVTDKAAGFLLLDDGTASGPVGVPAGDFARFDVGAHVRITIAWDPSLERFVASAASAAVPPWSYFAAEGAGAASVLLGIALALRPPRAVEIEAGFTLAR